MTNAEIWRELLQEGFWAIVWFIGLPTVCLFGQACINLWKTKRKEKRRKERRLRQLEGWYALWNQ